MERVRIGIIGLGIMGDLYAKVYSAHPLAEVVAVADLKQGKADECCARYNISHGYLDHRKMLERNDLDAVVVATPDRHHFGPARDVLDSARHVLVEKPFTTSVTEADELLRLAQRKHRKIQVSFNHRWLSPYHQARKTITSGQIGKLLAAHARKNDTIYVATDYISWAGESTSAWFLSSHDIDLIRWYFDSEPAEARAWGRKEVLAARGIPTYDIIQAQIRFASGAIATFESAWVYPNCFPSIVDSFVEVIGEAGHIHMDRKYESIEVSTNQSFTYPKGFLNCEIFGRMRGAFPSCLEDFLYSIINDKPPLVTGFDGRQVTSALEAIHRALATGGTEKVELQPADIQAGIQPAG